MLAKLMVRTIMLVAAFASVCCRFCDGLFVSSHDHPGFFRAISKFIEYFLNVLCLFPKMEAHLTDELFAMIHDMKGLYKLCSSPGFRPYSGPNICDI